MTAARSLRPWLTGLAALVALGLAFGDRGQPTRNWALLNP